jgi:2-haloalkanoic acid dehalogenase type II
VLKGILFDLGGTLYSYEKLEHATHAVVEKLVEELRLDRPIAEVQALHREANKHADRHYADVPYYLFRDYFLTIFEFMLERLGRPELRDHFDWFEEYQRVMLLSSMQIKDDCHATLQRLRQQGLYLSVVSNADENMLHPLITRAGLKPYLDHWTSSEAARSCKPDRRFFEVALQKSGLRAEEVLFVGDSLEQDIHGAHGLGIRTVLISEHDRPAPMHLGRQVAEPSFKIRRLTELLDIVATLQ